MKVHDLTEAIIGQRIRVTGVAVDEAERNGYVNDTEALMGETGTAEAFRNPGTLGLAQLRMTWDTDKPGTLCLASNDEIEIINEEDN